MARAPNRPFDGTKPRAGARPSADKENGPRGLRARTAMLFLTMLRNGEPIWWTKTSGNPFGGTGNPDFLVCYGGMFGALELKSPGGGATVLQQRTLDKIERAQGLDWVADSDADVTTFLNVLRARARHYRKVARPQSESEPLWYPRERRRGNPR